MHSTYVLKELRHRRHRTLVNILGIAVGIALFISLNAAADAYRRAVSQPFKNLGADLVVQRSEQRAVNSSQPPAAMSGIRLPFSNQPLATRDWERLRTLDGVDAVSTALLLWEFNPEGFRTIIGVDFQKPGPGPVKVKEWIKEGRIPESTDEVALEKHFASFHHLRRGDILRIGNGQFKVVGLIEIKEGAQIASATLYLPLVEARALLGGEPDAVNLLYLRLNNPSLLNRVKARIASQIEGVTVTSSDSFLELMGGVSRISDQFALVASLVGLGGAILLIIRAMLAGLVERTREIGILKAMGWTGSDIKKQLMGEVFVQSLLGGIAGILLGYGISSLLGLLTISIPIPWELNPMPVFAREAETAARVRLPVNVSAGLMAVSMALSVVIGLVASQLMWKRASRMKPAEVLRQL